VVATTAGVEAVEGRRDPMTDDDIDTLVADAVLREEDVPFMYRDASEHGWVTCGVGKKLNSAREAAQLPFEVAGRRATVAEISSDYVRVLSLPPAHVATYYRSAQSPMLPDGYARDLCRRELLSVYLPGVSKVAGDVDTLPLPVVRALLTIDYTCGIGGLATFTHLLGSVGRRDWQGIVDRREYHMRASDATNERLRDWFVEAA